MINQTLRLPILVSFLLFSLSLYGSDPIKLFSETETKQFAGEDFFYSTLIIDDEMHSQIYNSRSSTLVLEIPYLGNVYEVELHSYELLTHDFKLKTDGGVEVPYTPGIYYRGQIAEHGGMVAFSFFENDIIGLMSTKKGKMLNIGRPLSGGPNEYVIYDTNEVESPKTIECHSEDMPQYAEAMQNIFLDVASDNPTRMGDCVNFYVEGDYTLNLNKGGVVEATDFITGLWNPVSTIFDNEDVEVNISEIFVWDSDDGYSTSNAGVALGQFKDNNPTYNGDLAHLMALGGNNLGGVAYLDVICSSNFGYAYSNINSNYNDFPAYSWTVNVVSHENGHNLGSPHTHSCSWPGGAIDNCWTPEGSCSPGPNPSGGGTIMSYCHVTSFGVNFNNGFGPLPGDKIRDEVDAASCLGSCIELVAGDPPTADFSWVVVSYCDSDPAEVHYFDESEDDPDEWFWTFPGGNPATSTVQNPIVTYDTQGSYSATLEVENEYGDDEISYSNVITVEPSPIVFFDVVITGSTVFTDNLSQFSTDYDWDFDDGFEPNVFEPVHTYDEDGFYTITLEGENDCGDDEYSLEIEIATPPVAGFTMTNGIGCAALTVDFTSTSSNNTDDWLWDFPGGTPSTSTEANPTVIYTTSGVYDVTLTVTNETGTDMITMTDVIAIEDVPATGYTYTVDEGEVTFTNTSSTATSYEWDFGDGSISTLTDPVYTYTTGGTYTVTLTGTNVCGSTTHTEEILIELEPEAFFSNSDPEGCATHTVEFSDLSTGADTYLWEFDGGNPATSTDQNPIVTYDSKGEYDVTLTVTNAFGTSEYNLEELVIIDDVPESLFNYTEDEGTVDFDNQTSNAISYFWAFGDGNTSTQVNPTHTYNAAGDYLVTLVATNDCGDSQYISQVVAAIQPVAGFTNNNPEGCATHSVQYTSTSTDTDTYLWEFEGGTPSTSTDVNPVVDYVNEGIFQVTLTVTNDFGTDEIVMADLVIIDDVPVTGFNFSENSGVVTFTNESTNADSYAWDFGDGNTSTQVNPTHTYSDPGEYTVSLTATNDCGDNESVQTVIASIEPVASFASSEADGCVTHTVTYEFTGTNADSYEWEFPGGNPSTSTASNPTVEYTSVGSYDVSLIVSNAFGSDEAVEADYVTVSELPNTDFEYSTLLDEVTFTNVTEGGSNPMWDFGDGNTSIEDSPVHTYEGEGTYFVTLTTENECGQSVQTEPVTITNAPSVFIGANATESCLPATFTFSNESINADDIVWEFPGGNPAISTDDNPVVVYTSPGTYDVILTASNISGSNQVVFEDYITVSDIPSAAFDLESDGLDIAITDNSTGGESYLWDFGDGNTSTAVSPEHTYDAEGVYTVTLEVSNTCGSASIVETQVNNYTLPSASITQNKEEACTNENVRYFSNPSANTESYLWELEGATPTTSTAKNPLVQYSEGGTYSVTLTVTNPAGDESYTVNNTVVIRVDPVADFVEEQDGLISTFTHESVAGTDYSWDFGDGNTSSENNPAHTYEAEGLYTVTLTTTNVCGSALSTQEVNNYTSPTADFRQNKDIACVGENVRYFQEASDNAVDYLWSLPGATVESSTNRNVLVQYEEAGSYDVTLVVTNPAGSDELVKVSTVTIIDEPNAEFTAIRDLFDVTFINGSEGADMYAWDFGDGNTSSDENPNHTYDLPGTYEVTLTTTNACGSNIVTQVLQISARPTANFTTSIGLNSTTCLPATVQYVNLSSSNVETVLWTFPGGNPSTSTELDPQVTYNETGTFGATLEVFSSDDSDMITMESVVVVVDEPISDFALSMVELNIIATDLSQDANTVTWYVNGVETAEGSELDFLPLFNGDYEIRQVVSNVCGDSESTQLISVTTYPDASYTSSEPAICEGMTITYDASFEDNLTYLWTFEGGTPATSTEQNPTVTYDENGTYPVALVVTNLGGESDIFTEDYVTVGLNPEAEPTFSLVDESIIDASVDEVDGMSYEWYVDGELISTTSELTFQMTDPGTYIVTLIASNDCGELTFTEEYEFLISATEDELELTNITILPNPATDYIKILSEANGLDQMNYSLNDITGKQLLLGALQKDTELLDVSELPGGVYILSIRQGDKSTHEKIVVSQ